MFDLSQATDVAATGGKAKALGSMIRAGFVVPEGFVISTAAFDDMSKALQSDILKHFDILQTDFVAVRSSATSEDSGSAAWAGQLDTFLNVDRQHLIAQIKKCWESIHSDRAQAYAKEKSQAAGKVAVVVQKMVQSDVSGVAFSTHPVTQDDQQVVIEAGFGLGEAVVSGEITPDTYIVAKKPATIVEKHLAEQTKQLKRGADGQTSWQKVDHPGAQKLADKYIVELSQTVQKLENYFGHAVDVEWALAGQQLFILQSRPITTLA